MSNDEFTKLYVHMTQHFRMIEQKLDAKADKSDLKRVYVALNGISARLDTDNVERAAMASQLDRHEIWIKQLAKKTNTPLAS
jgi:hypothetical protein